MTYHDPCYLGRWNNCYDAPRAVLNSLPGLEYIEMPRSRASSLCCGGGGGNFYTDMIGSGLSSPSRHRVREALECGAQVIAVSCPSCYKMLSDAVMDEEAEDRLEVVDIAGLVTRSII